MPNPVYPQPIPTTPALDPAFDSLTSAEQREAWWRGSDDEQAVQAGDDVEWATEEHFPSGLHRSRLKDEDWARVAYFIAKGVSVTEVAKHFGVSRTTIWRGMQRSSGLRRRILSERRMLQRECDSRFVALRDAVVTGLIEAISAGNVRVLLWAAKRLDLGGSILPAPSHAPPPRPGRDAANDGAPPLPRIRRAPPAVRAILVRAAEQVDAAALAPPTPTRPLAPPPMPNRVPKPAATQTGGTRRADPPASPRPAPATTAPKAAPVAAPARPSPARALRQARPPVRQLVLRIHPPCPPLAEDVDIRVTDTLLQNCRHQGLGRPVCDNDGPLDPYRPLRTYHWP